MIILLRRYPINTLQYSYFSALLHLKHEIIIHVFFSFYRSLHIYIYTLLDIFMLGNIKMMLWHYKQFIKEMFVAYVLLDI